MIVTDTSFLFSLFGSDAHTTAAQTWARQAKQPIAVTTLNRYEFANAIRFAAFRKAISRSDALTSLAAFDADLQHGILQLTPCDLTAVVNEAERLSELRTLTGGHRSFDILHIATACVLKATTILTFDLNQRKLANAVRLSVGP
ncbi:MAG: type II toxin-antitoxin system VapC family toxin [Opitutaceae bacterium]